MAAKLSVVKYAPPGSSVLGCFAGVDQVVVFQPAAGGAHAQNAVLALQDDFAPFRGGWPPGWAG